MPTYEYVCTSCNHDFEVFQSMKDAPLTECPKCGQRIRRVIGGGAGIIFKGSGFYVNDSRKTSSSSVASSATPASKPECATCTKSAAPVCEAKKEAV